MTSLVLHGAGPLFLQLTTGEESHEVFLLTVDQSTGAVRGMSYDA
jgi:hypothetical protein